MLDSNTLEAIKSFYVDRCFMPSMIFNEDLIIYSEKGIRVNAVNNSNFEEVWNCNEWQLSFESKELYWESSK